MTEHIDQLILSAYLDDQVTSSESEAVARHLAACPACRAELDDLGAVVQLMKGLPLAGPTTAESGALEQALITAPAVQERRGWMRPAWAGLGAAAALIVGVIAFNAVSGVRSGSSDGPTSAASAIPLIFTSDEQVRLVVSKDPKVVDGTHQYSVDDVGTMQERILGELPEVRSLENTRAAVSDDLSSPQQDQAQSAGGSKSAPQANELSPSSFPAGSGRACLAKVLRSQPYPMIPLYAGESSYKSQAAWMLIYAWTPSVADKARLDQVQVWMVQPADCRTLMYQSFKIAK